MGTGNLQIQLPISKVTLTKHAKGSWTADVYDSNNEFAISHHLEKADVDLLESGEQLQAELDTAKELLESRTVPTNIPHIVCLCGSTRFMDAFFEVGWKFTLEGKIVLSVGVCKHAEHHGGEALGQDVADRLDELHLRKIDLADSVYVLNVGGYIGDSTRKEIDYAKANNKPVKYLNP